MDVTSVALSGMQNAQSSLRKTAERIAGVSPATADSVDLSAEMVTMLSARNQFQADVRMLQAAENLQKKLLDLLA